MYERFTDRARKVMQLAYQEAQRFNHEYVGTEHILLGLVKECSGVAANVLKNMDVSLRAVRAEVEKIVASGPDMVSMAKLPQTPRAQKVVELAVQSARELNVNYVGTEHLLLGLIKEGEGIACQILKNLGVTAEDVTEDILHLLGHKQYEKEKTTPRPVDALATLPNPPVQLEASWSGQHFFVGFHLAGPQHPDEDSMEKIRQCAHDIAGDLAVVVDLKKEIQNSERERCALILDEMAKATESAAAKAAYLLAAKRIREDVTEKKEAERRPKQKDNGLPTLRELRGTFQGALEGKTATEFVRDIRDAQD